MYYYVAGTIQNPPQKSRSLSTPRVSQTIDRNDLSPLEMLERTTLYRTHTPQATIIPSPSSERSSTSRPSRSLQKKQRQLEGNGDQERIYQRTPQRSRSPLKIPQRSSPRFQNQKNRTRIPQSTPDNMAETPQFATPRSVRSTRTPQSRPQSPTPRQRALQTGRAASLSRVLNFDDGASTSRANQYEEERVNSPATIPTTFGKL